MNWQDDPEVARLSAKLHDAIETAGAGKSYLSLKEARAARAAWEQAVDGCASLDEVRALDEPTGI